MLRWFPSLFGFQEYQLADVGEIQHTRENFLKTQEKFKVLNATHIQSLSNDRLFTMGEFSTPTLHELRIAAAALLPKCDQSSREGTSDGADDGDGDCTTPRAGIITHEHLAITDAFKMHSENPTATFQAASQFNCLEFGAPHVTPEHGVASYAYDETQGPACALACAAGTIFRNYFVSVEGVNASEVDGKEGGRVPGQSTDAQLNNLDELELMLNNEQNNYWSIRNGYSFATEESLARLTAELELNWLDDSRRDELRAAVKVGVQAGTEVTFSRRFTAFPPEAPEILVNQVYCSALSCGYSNVHNSHWAPLASLILEASYEATLLAAMACHIRGACSHSTTASSSSSAVHVAVTAGAEKEPHRVFLTFLGGGVFRNEPSWIARAIGRALAVVSRRLQCLGAGAGGAGAGVSSSLHVVICHFRRIDPLMRDMIDRAFVEEMDRLENSSDVDVAR